MNIFLEKKLEFSPAELTTYFCVVAFLFSKVSLDPKKMWLRNISARMISIDRTIGLTLDNVST